MNRLHQTLTQKYPKYNNWHQIKHHNTIHWGVLAVFTLLVFGTISRWTPISFAADTTAPTTPTSLTATPISSSQINLSWTASGDDVGVVGYKIYRCAGSACAPTVQIATSATNSYSDTGLTASTAYTYAVLAYDAAGNESGKSGSVSATTQAPPTSTNPINNLEPGHWYEVPDSKLRFVLPNPLPPGSPVAIMTAWSGGAFDTKRDRLIVWGGGHGDYAGNEIYVFDLNTLAWKRVNEPSNPIGADLPYAPDGNPSAVHTYSYLQYVPNIDRFCSFGGQGFYPGISGAPYTNCFNFETLEWEQRADTTSPGIGAFSAVDPVTGHIWQRGNVNNANLSDFDPLKNTWTVRTQNEDNGYMYRVTAAIDPVRHKFVAVGLGEVYSWDIGGTGFITRQSLTTTGATEILNVNNPGFEYDPVSKKFVAWGGGADVYTLDMDTLVWTKHTPAPTNIVTPTVATEHGTFGRFRYSPKNNIFVVVNDIDQNVYIYRLNPGGGTPPPTDTTAPSIPANLTATPISQSQINLSWTISTDNVGVMGYKIYRCLGSACAPTVQIATSPTNSYSNTGLTASTAYTYATSAYDAAGKESGKSGSVSATTQNIVSPPTGGQATSFQLTSKTNGTLPFTTGLAFKKGDVPDVPILDLSNSQVIVKRRWNDGSVKHAIASGQVVLTAGTPKTINVLSHTSSISLETNLTAEDIQTANPSASVQLGSFGTVDLSALLAAPFRTWISGPEMVEAHYRSAVGNDPTLVVWFHVRLYKGGQIWIRAIVENGYLDIAAETKNYTAMVNINGVNSYTGNITHYPHTRWTAESWIGGDPQVTPRLDTQYLIDAKLVPNYWKRNPSATALDNLYQSYAPFENGGWTKSMGMGGFQNQIGLLPLWDALYISSGGDERALKSVIANTKALNSYPIVWNDSATQLPTIPSNRPTWTAYGKGGGGGTMQSAGTLLWELAHHPSGGYLAYLISGDYYFLETMQNQSSLCYLSNSSTNGSGTTRRFTSETRAVAWCKRTVGQFAAIGPLDAITTDYQALLSNNVSYWKSEIDRPSQNLIGYLYAYEIWSKAYGVGALAPWQQHFWIQTYGHLSDLEPVSNMTDLNSVRDFLYKGIVGILGPVGGDNYCYEQASRYTITISASSDNDPTTWYDSWGQVYEATTGSPNTSCGTTLGGSSGGAPSAAATGFWGNLLPAIAYAVDHGAPGASASWLRLTNATNWSAVENSGFDDIPIWGIVPRTQLPADTIPPTTPENLSAATVSATQINLSWNTSTDNIGVAGYKIYRCAGSSCTPTTQIATSATNSYSNTGLAASTIYTYAVFAYDAAGNESAKSQSVSATTLSQFKPSDLNQDQKVDQLDFDILKQDWKRTDKPKSDLNQDGIVDSRDLGILMSSWEN